MSRVDAGGGEGTAPARRGPPRADGTVSLLTYPDRLARDLPGLAAVLRDELPEFDGVHILPFYDPIDGVDAGFDPRDHAAVDPRIGNWADLATIARNVAVTADVIVNHVSHLSAPVRAFLAGTDDPRWEGMVLTYDSVLPGGADAHEITSFYRPRPGLPFTPYVRADGTKSLLWTTFSPEQVDVDVRARSARAYIRSILESLAGANVRTVRLDAIGYAVKTPGTSSFMTAETFAFIDDLVAECHQLDLDVLVEVHADYRTQLAVAAHADRIYDFALPPLLLHAVYTGDLAPLARWLALRPDSAVAVLDTHDGIGVVDATTEDGSVPGLLSPAQADALFSEASRRTAGRSEAASVVPQFAPRPHQINASFLSVLGADTEALVALRAIQLLVPGPSHVYYGGLLSLSDDVERFENTGVGREINRSVLSENSRRRCLARPASRAQRALIQLRTSHPAVTGTPVVEVDEQLGTVAIAWSSPGGARLELRVVFTAGSAHAEVTMVEAESGSILHAAGVEGLAALLES